MCIANTLGPASLRLFAFLQAPARDSQLRLKAAIKLRAKSNNPTSNISRPRHALKCHTKQGQSRCPGRCPKIAD